MLSARNRYRKIAKDNGWDKSRRWGCVLRLKCCWLPRARKLCLGKMGDGMHDTNRRDPGASGHVRCRFEDQAKETADEPKLALESDSEMVIAILDVAKSCLSCTFSITMRE